MPRVRPVTRAGFFAAVVLASLSVLPSLVPRSGPLQGLLMGSCAAIGYAVVSSVARSPVHRRDLWGMLVPVLALFPGWRWQIDLAVLSGAAAPGPAWIPMAAFVGLAVFGVWLGLGRLVRWVTVNAGTLLGRAMPAPLARGVAVVVVGGLLIAGVVRLPDLTVALLDTRFLAMNAAVASPSPPTSRYVSGGPASSIPWSALGNQGQQFVTAAVTRQQLRTFTGRPALAPIRAFVGVDSAGTAQQRAELAVRELERLGGFERAVIAVGTSAGAGIVDNGEVQPLEYLLNGDVATVSTQYSVLPSFLSFLVDQPNAVEAAQTLLAAVRERASEQRRPPRIVVFGESLGAYGSSSMFSDLPDVLARTDGAMWQGPPNASPLWQAYTRARDPGSPQVQPVYDHGRHLRWANTPDGLTLPSAWQAPRVLFLQNASDPVVWWSPTTAWSRPDWMTQPRGPGVLPWVPWLPLLTFAGLTGDMMNSQGVPPGFGHVYGTDPVYAWAAILTPPGWTAQDSERLAAHLS